jgi:hypothetical protein
MHIQTPYLKLNRISSHDIFAHITSIPTDSSIIITVHTTDESKTLEVALTYESIFTAIRDYCMSYRASCNNMDLDSFIIRTLRMNNSQLSLH